ncbi:hypothetical protein A9C11_20870 [Pseudomonas citronellolis]|uniref:Uncharacterized protein n=1 Tax=Pseudomonas citronellolis TaxID=53408 RepID=A0A1A9KFI1_9PSED|nr:hypothetical protein A9C11_20870 [Pseudomonas citronellolis]
MQDGKRLGADEVVLSSDAQAMAAHGSTLDLIIDAVSAPHYINPYLDLLKQDGTLLQAIQPFGDGGFALVARVWREPGCQRRRDNGRFGHA